MDLTDAERMALTTLRVGDILVVDTDWLDPPMPGCRPFNRGRYRVTELRDGVFSRHLKPKDRICVTLYKEAKTGRRGLYYWVIATTHLHELIARGDARVTERGGSDAR